jgi:uncharacterized protein YjiS (DUF1127 family)
MFYDTSTRKDSQPRFWSFLATALQPWHMLARLMEQRRDYVRLSNLDDHMLKDIGLTRGRIRSAIRHGRVDR